MEMIVKKLLLTKRDVCHLLGFSPASIDRFRFAEEYRHLAFPRAVKIGFKVFWNPAEIEAWAEAQLAKRDTP
jgi:predicted DNA-binding transcriptional regulator AlpA